MRGALFVIIAFQIWLVWQKVDVLGVVGSWPWIGVLIPAEICIFLGCLVAYLIRRDNR